MTLCYPFFLKLASSATATTSHTPEVTPPPVVTSTSTKPPEMRSSYFVNIATTKFSSAARDNASRTLEATHQVTPVTPKAFHTLAKTTEKSPIRESRTTTATEQTNEGGQMINSQPFVGAKLRFCSEEGKNVSFSKFATAVNILLTTSR